LVHVGRDLFGSPLRGDVLGMSQLGPSGGSGQGYQIVGDYRHGSPGAFLPWRVCGGIDDDLADNPPAGVMRVATCDQKPCERLRNALGVRVRRVDAEMPQRCADVPTAVDCPCQVPCCGPWSVSRVGDQPTVPAGRRRIAMTPTWSCSAVPNAHGSTAVGSGCGECPHR
jgi:hypothetical protein